ncbi:MAG TPA: hypothetical protein VLI39_05355 [Sedimentisphaerales bacterium]|nr:hypothetical protein [Sedimentisphaerales bacterium]
MIREILAGGLWPLLLVQATLWIAAGLAAIHTVGEAFLSDLADSRSIAETGDVQ